MTCQICFESFPNIYKVNCGSTVDHEICFDCETRWRAKMTIRDGKRVMSCPTCRQEETFRTVDSLEREVAELYASPRQEVTLIDAMRVIVGLDPSTRAYIANRIGSTVAHVSVLCASGRECVTRSQVNSRVKTRLKCRRCREVACCARCNICTGCRPL